MSRKKIRSHWCCASCGREHLRSASITVQWWAWTWTSSPRPQLQFCSQSCIKSLAVEAALVLLSSSTDATVPVHPRVYRPRRACDLGDWRTLRRMQALMVVKLLQRGQRIDPEKTL